MDSLGQSAVVKDGKFLTFVLGDDEYGIEILKVREIIGMQALTEVPGSTECVKGVFNLRGRVVPVLDLFGKLLLPAAAQTEATCLIVIEIRHVLLAVIVDTVSEVVDIAGEDIDPPPSFGIPVPTEYVSGMGKVKGKVKILLKLDAVLSDQELTTLSSFDSRPTRK